MARVLLLTLLLLALGAAACLPFAVPEVKRDLALWGLPVAAMVLSLALFPRLPRPEELAPRPPGRRLLLLSAALVALLLDQSFLGIGLLAHQVAFRFADPGGGFRFALTAMWALPACLVLGIWGWERALRGSLYTGWRQRLPAPAALALSVLTGAVLSLPLLLPRGGPQGGRLDLAYGAAALTAVLCREISCALLFRHGGGLLIAGLYRGALVFLAACIATDSHDALAPFYSYTAAGPAFYAVRAASALLAAGLLVWVTQSAPVLSIEKMGEDSAHWRES